ncbi:MAG: hypothetical protein IPG88_27485 [Gemmatimonadetes bacterium]|jgi:hypothetical protein|nr:hypothetical protein [Gemmatimonadota bacterium]
MQLPINPRLSRWPLALATLLPLATSAQAAPGHPCTTPSILQALQREAPMRTPMLYDGMAPLARAPATPIQLPTDIPGNSCVLLSVRLAARDGVLYVEDAAFAAVSHPAIQMQMRRANYGTQVVRSATQVVREALPQGVYPVRPQAGTRYLVAVPVMPQHPLYASPVAPATVAAAPGGAPATLQERGWPGSTLAKVEGDLAIYRLGERGFNEYFAIVRPIAPDEPLLDFTREKGPMGFDIARYGPREHERFRAHIVPLLRDRGERYRSVTIYHYARGVTLERQPDSRFPWNGARHFSTGQEVEVPAAEEFWDGRRAVAGGPFQWNAGTERGTSATDLNTLAAIQKVQQGIAAQQRVYAENRAAMYAREAAELEGRRARARAREGERRRLLIAAGLHYLPPESWSRYALGPEFRAIFDGDWPNAAAHWEFGNLYARTIRAYSNRCRRLIPPDSPYQVSKTIRRDEFGNSWEPEGGDTTFIPRAFADPYVWWDKNMPQALPMAPGGLASNSVDGLLDMLGRMLTNPGAALTEMAILPRFAVAMREDMALLFAGGCQSPQVTQHMENMRRLALRLPSLQAERARAALPALGDWPPSVAGRCEQHEAERGAERSMRTWCSCLDQQFTTRWTLGERWVALEDYNRFFDEVAGFRTAADGKPVWARYEPANACRK